MEPWEMAAHASFLLESGLVDGVVMHVEDWRETKEIREAMPAHLLERVRFDERVTYPAWSSL